MFQGTGLPLTSLRMKTNILLETWGHTQNMKWHSFLGEGTWRVTLQKKSLSQVRRSYFYLTKSIADWQRTSFFSSDLQMFFVFFFFFYGLLCLSVILGMLYEGMGHHAKKNLRNVVKWYHTGGNNVSFVGHVHLLKWTVIKDCCHKRIIPITYVWFYLFICLLQTWMLHETWSECHRQTTALLWSGRTAMQILIITELSLLPFLVETTLSWQCQRATKQQPELHSQVRESRNCY